MRQDGFVTPTWGCQARCRSFDWKSALAGSSSVTALLALCALADFFCDGVLVKANLLEACSTHD